MLDLLKDIFPVAMVLLVVFGIVFILLLPFLASWKLFKKVGIPGWKSLIPIYNTYLIFEIAGMKGFLSIPVTLYNISYNVIYSFIGFNKLSDTWLIVFSVLFIYTFIVNIFRAIKLSKAFGKGTLFIIGMIFLPEIFEIILGMGKSKYLGDYNKK